MSNDAVHEEDYLGYKIKIIPDTDDKGLRDWDNLGTMVCWHRRYNLGDEREYPKESPEEFKERLAREIDSSVGNRIDHWENGKGWRWLGSIDHALNGDSVSSAESRIQKIIDKVIDKNVVILPLYLYDHSGITMNTTGFLCRWDSGQVGYIYVTREKILEEYSVKRISKKLRSMVIKILQDEVKTYDQWLCGDVYGYVIEKDDEHVDSCWGYYGEEDCITQAKSIIDSYQKEAA